MRKAVGCLQIVVGTAHAVMWAQWGNPFHSSAGALIVVLGINRIMSGERRTVRR